MEIYLFSFNFPQGAERETHTEKILKIFFEAMEIQFLV